eukprot:g46333.t1
MLLIPFFLFLRGVFADCYCTTGTIAATRTSLTPADNHVRALLTTTSIQGIPLQQIGCVTIDTPSFLKQKVELEVKKSDIWSVALASNCSISSFLVSAGYEDSELLVNVVAIKSSSARKVGVAKLSVFASLAFGLVTGSQQLYCNKPVPAPIAAAMLGLAQGAVAQSDAECRYIIQVTTPHPCFTAYRDDTDLHCSFGAKLMNCPVTAVSPSRSPSATASVTVSHTPSTSRTPVSASATASVSQSPSASLSPVSASASGSISETPSETSSTSLTSSVSSTVTPSASSTTSRSPGSSSSFSPSASTFSTCSPSPCPGCFITTWNMTVLWTLMFPLASIGAYNFQVDWGDGSSSYCNTATCSHQYSQHSIYTVSVSGLLQGFSFLQYDGMAKYLLDVLHWGGVCLGDGGGQFRGVTLTRWTASDDPCLSKVIDMSSMFIGASNFNQPLNTWNTSSVTKMQGMFEGASSFNQSLDTWDTSLVTSMNSMFRGASSFNQPLDTWDTSLVTTMSEMFVGASSFNQPLDTWDTSLVKDMEWMFYSASSFNQPLDTWNTSSVTNMGYMFFLATPFKQNLTSWNTLKVTKCATFGLLSSLCGLYLPQLGYCNFRDWVTVPETCT